MISRKIMVIIGLLGLCACDEQPDIESIKQKAKKETNELINEFDQKYGRHTANDVIDDREKKLDQLVQQQYAIEKKYMDMCHHRFDQEHGIRYPLAYQNNVCICFAEKITTFIYSGPKTDFERYQSSELYRAKVLEQAFNECSEKNEKYKRF